MAHVVSTFIYRDVGAPCVFREAREAGVFVYCEGSFRVAAACRGPKAERAPHDKLAAFRGRAPFARAGRRRVA